MNWSSGMHKGFFSTPLVQPNSAPAPPWVDGRDPASEFWRVICVQSKSFHVLALVMLSGQFLSIFGFRLWLIQYSPDIAMDWSDHAIWWPTRNIWLDKTRWAFKKQTLIKEKYQKIQVSDKQFMKYYTGGRWTSTAWTQTQWSISRQCTRPSGKTSIPMMMTMLMTMMTMTVMMMMIGRMFI